MHVTAISKKFVEGWVTEATEGSLKVIFILYVLLNMTEFD